MPIAIGLFVQETSTLDPENQYSPSLIRFCQCKTTYPLSWCNHCNVFLCLLPFCIADDMVVLCQYALQILIYVLPIIHYFLFNKHTEVHNDMCFTHNLEVRQQEAFGISLMDHMLFFHIIAASRLVSSPPPLFYGCSDCKYSIFPSFQPYLTAMFASTAHDWMSLVIGFNGLSCTWS